jgi:hypothetical protein
VKEEEKTKQPEDQQEEIKDHLNENKKGKRPKEERGGEDDQEGIW